MNSPEGYRLLVTASTYQIAAYDAPEPYKTELHRRAMSYYHMAALDEHARRLRGDKPDHVHLSYL